MTRKLGAASWSEVLFAWFRRTRSADSRAVNLGALLACGAVLGAALFVAPQPTPRRVGLLVVMLVVVLNVVSGRFAATLVRTLVVLGTVVVLAALVNLGRHEEQLARLRQGRIEASELAARLDPPPDAAATTAASKAQLSLAAVEKEVAKTPADIAAQPTLAIVSDLRALLADEVNRKRLDDIRKAAAALPAGSVANAVSKAMDSTRDALGVKPPPSPAKARTAVDTLCRQSGGRLSSRHCEPSKEVELSREAAIVSRAAAGAVEVAVGDSRTAAAVEAAPDTVDESRAAAAIEVARHRLAVASAEVDKKALGAEIATAEKALAKAAGASVAGPADLDLIDSLRRGASSVVELVPWFRQKDGGGVSLVLGAVGWPLVGGLGLLLFRRFEQRASRNALGPIEVDTAGDADSVDVEQFRTFLLRNIPDPGAVPGSEALQPFSDLLGSAAGPAGVISKVLKAVLAILGEKRGYTVMFKDLDATKKKAEADNATADEPTSPPPARPPGTRIVVRVSIRQTKRVIDQKIVVAPKRDEAIRRAAYWAAAVVIERSDRVPRWAQWSPATSDSLAAFYSREDTAASLGVELIEMALAGAPTSGVLCLLASHENALAGNHLRAFELALRTKTLNSCFVAAKYRVAIAASLVASAVDAHWVTRPLADRQRLIAAIGRAGDDDGGELVAALRRASTKPELAKAALCNYALRELEACASLLSMANLLRSSLRRSERSYWLAFLAPQRTWLTRRTQFRQAMEAARPVLQRRAGLRADDVVDTGRFWQVTYNRACFHAIRVREDGAGAADDAMACLEATIERPESHQLTKRWVDRDPDLESLRVLDRFKRFQELLPDDGGTDADSS